MNFRIPDKYRSISGSCIYIFLLVSIVVVYGQAFRFTFVSLDDYMYVRDNFHISGGITPGSMKWAFTAFYAGNWHPATWISHMLDVQFFGMDPGAHHAVNVFLHLANTLLLFFCLKKMTGDLWKSALVAFLFGLHPLHVESVAWISERKDVLSTFFLILTLFFYTWYIEHRSAGRYALVATCFILGLMAKPMLVTLPFVLLLLDIWPLKRFELSSVFSPAKVEEQTEKKPAPRKNKKKSAKPSLSSLAHPDKAQPAENPIRLILEKIPLLILAGAASVFTVMAQKGSGAMSNLEIIPLYVRIENAIISYCMYLGKMLWPYRLAAFYPFPRMISHPLFMLSAAVLIAVTFLVILNMKKAPYSLVGWFWYLGTLVPVIGIIQVGSQSMADRYTYVPLIGIFIMIAWGIPQLLEKWRPGRYVIPAVCAVIIPLFIWTSWMQTGYWRDNITLFSHAIHATENNYVAHNSLGVALCEKGDFDAGIDHYIESLRIYPEHVQARNNLGAALIQKGKYEASIGHFKKAIQIEPSFVNAYYNLGIALYSLGRIDEAIQRFEETLSLDPQNSGAVQRVQIARETQGKLAAAINQLDEAYKNDPRNYLVQCRLAELYRSKGNAKEAIRLYENALTINPDIKQILPALSALYNETGDYNKALIYLQKMLKFTPDNPDVYYNLACVYSKQGKDADAVKCLTAAIKKGYRDRLLLKADPDLESMWNTGFYRQIFPED